MNQVQAPVRRRIARAESVSAPAISERAMLPIRWIRSVIFLAAALLCVLVGVADPRLGFACLALACVAYAALTRDYLNPAVVMGCLSSVTVLLGGLNFSNYRGAIYTDTFTVMLHNIAAMTIAILAIGGDIWPAQKSRASNARIPAAVIFMTAIPGLVGLMLVVLTTHTLPLINPDARFLMSGSVSELAQSLTVTACLAGYRLLTLTKRKPSDYALLLVPIGALLIPGYRGWPLIAVMMFLLVAVPSGRLKLSAPTLAGIAAAGFGFLTAMQLYRRASNPEMLMTPERAAAHFHVAGLPPFLQQMHFYLRDAMSIGQALILDREKIQIPHNLLFLDLIASIKPGHAISGGQIVGKAFGAVSKGGLTPGANATVYLLVGDWSPLVFAGFGIVIGLLWRRFRAANDLTFGFVCAMLTVFGVHWINRGMIKPTYIIEPLYFIACIVAVQWLFPQRRRESARRVRGSAAQLAQVGAAQ